MGAERTQHVGPVRHGDLQGNKQSLGCSDRKLLRASCRVLFFPLLSYDKALTVHFFQVPKQEDAACLVRTQDATLARVLPSGRYRPERHVRLSQRGEAQRRSSHIEIPPLRLRSSSRSLRFPEGESLSREWIH